jgi:hypothetical protein
MAIFVSPRLPRSIASFLAVAGAAGAFAATGPASADAAPLQTAKYDYAQMPDLDQNRNMGTDAAGVAHAGLPGNGDAYCGPTSGMDALAWMAQTAKPTLNPGVQDWTLGTNYETATGHLTRMGQLMSTHPVNGTTQDNFETGLMSWSAANGTYFYTGSVFGEQTGWAAPDLAGAQKQLALGNPVIVRLGWYTPVTKTIEGRMVQTLERTGGHWVTMTGYGPEGITFVDPADTADRMAPSARTQVVQAVQPVTGVYGGSNADGTPWLARGWVRSKGVVSFPQSTLLRMAGYSGGNGYIEGFTVLRPSWTLSLEGVNLKYVEGERIRKWPLPTGTLGDAQVSPVGDVVYYSMKNSRTIYKANVLTGVTNRLATVNAPITKLSVSPTGDRVQAKSGSRISTVTNTGRPIGAVLRPDLATLPATQLNPAVLQAPVARSAKIDTAVETPSLLTERVIRRSAPIRATGINARLGGS